MTNGVVRDIRLMSIGAVATSGLAFLSVPLTIRLVNLDGYGSLIIGQAVTFVILSFLVPPVWEIVQKFGVGSDKDYRRLHAVYYRWRHIELVLSVAALSISIVLVWFLSPYIDIGEGINLSLIGVISAAFANISSHNGRLRAEGKFVPTVVGPIIVQSIRLAVLAIASISDSRSMWAVAIAYAGAESLRIGYLEYQCRHRLTHQANRAWVTPEERRFAVTLCLTRAADVPVQQVDKLVAGVFLGPSQAAYLAVIRRVGAIFGLISEPLRQALSPRIYALASRGHLRDAVSLGKKAGVWILSLGAVAFVIFLSAQGSILHLITDGAWPPSAVLTLNIYVLCTIVALAFTAIHTLCYAAHKERAVLALTVFANALFLLITVTQVQQHGLYAFGAAFMVHYFVVLGGKVAILGTAGRHDRPHVTNSDGT